MNKNATLALVKKVKVTTMDKKVGKGYCSQNESHCDDGDERGVIWSERGVTIIGSPALVHF